MDPKKDRNKMATPTIDIFTSCFAATGNKNIFAIRNEAGIILCGV